MRNVMMAGILALTLPIVSASTAAAADFAVVNIQTVMESATAAKDIREQLNKKQKAFQADLKKKAESLQKERADISKQQSVLSKEAFEKKARAFTKKETDAQKEIRKKRTVIDKAAENALAEIQKNTVEIVSDIAKEKKLKLVIPTSQIMFAGDGLDISDEVLKRLNKKLPKFKVSFDK